jgi:short-subunit dehydrogenase
MGRTREAPTGALVTGASSGIGRATALALADRGVPLVLTGRSPEVLEEVAEACRARGGTASVVELDVRDGQAVDAAVADAAERYGPGLAVVHSAAVVAYGPFEEVPAHLMSSVVATNVLGTIAVSRAALEAFRRTGSGHLVVVGSLLGQVSAPYMSSYVLSKWAVHGLVRTLQVETRHRSGVSVSLVSPGGVDTPIYRRAATVLGRHGTPPPPVGTAEDVAERVVRVLLRPRRQTHVGPANAVVVAGFRLFPAVYDALATPLLRTFALEPWHGLLPTPGNVEHPQHPAPAGDEPSATTHPHRPSQEEHAMTETTGTSSENAVHRPRVSRSVAAPAEAVWAVLSDGWQYATWVVGASRVRAVDAGWPARGTRLHHSVGVWPALLSDSTVSEESEEPRHLVLTARGWPLGEARVEIEIVPDGPESCTVSIAEDASNGPGRLVPMPVRQLGILPRNREALRRLGLIAEGRHREWLAGS